MRSSARRRSERGVARLGNARRRKSGPGESRQEPFGVGKAIMKRFETTPERLLQCEKLAEYLHSQPDGEELSWERIEADTHITMRPRTFGRPLVWKVLRKIKRPYEAIVGVGVRLSAPSTAMTIVRGRFLRINGAVNIASRTQQQLQDRHLDKMSAEEQRKMIMAAAFFATVRAIAHENRQRMLR